LRSPASVVVVQDSGNGLVFTTVSRFDISNDVAAECDGERDRDGSGGGAIRSAGFGNVLYVDPREVYLNKHRKKRKKMGFGIKRKRDLPLVIKRAIAHSQPSQEIPDVCIAPIDNGINAFEVGPTLIRLCAMRKGSC